MRLSQSIFYRSLAKNTDNFSNQNSLKINLDPLDLKKDYENVLVLDDGGKRYIDLNNNQISKETIIMM